MVKGPLYDYQNQCWIDIDTSKDERIKDTGESIVYSHNGVLYEVKKGTDLYRNYSGER